MKIEFISHSRLYSPENPNQKSSEVWTSISQGAKKGVSTNPRVSLTVTGPENYHQVDEFLSLVENAVFDHDNDFLILPFSPQGKANSQFVKTLQAFEGRIVAVNVPPSEKTLKSLKDKIVGYIGPCEPEMGRRALRELMVRGEEALFTDLVVAVVAHEKDHYGHSLRIAGVKKQSQEYGNIIRTHIVEIDPVNPDLQFPDQLRGKEIGVITLGVRGTEAVLNSSWQEEIKDRLVGMDLNPYTSKAIDKKQLLCTLIQHPLEQGLIASKLAASSPTLPEESYRELYCGPTVTDIYNHLVFLK